MADSPKPDDGDLHSEMLRHLAENPPPARPIEPRRREKRPAAPPSTPSRPVLMLRRLRLELAMDRLEQFVRIHHRRGSEELLIIAGRGNNSPGGEPVLGPAVREWCGKHPDLVSGVQEAPPEAGGSGAMVVRLTRW